MKTIHTPQRGERPLFLLDVEGVFLTLDENNPETPPSEGYVRFEATPHDFYNPAHSGLLKKILPQVDAYWFTGVRPDTAEHLEAELVLPDMPFVDFFAVHGQQPRPTLPISRSPRDDLLHYKREAADFLFAGRSIAWIDDWFGSYDFEWAAAREATGAETLLIRTDYKQGLQPGHIERVEEWVGGLAVTEDSI